jgi:hypothetical protein
MTGGGGPHLSSMLGRYSIFFQQAPVRLRDESLRSVTKAIFLLHCFLWRLALAEVEPSLRHILTLALALEQ